MLSWMANASGVSSAVFVDSSLPVPASNSAVFERLFFGKASGDIEYGRARDISADICDASS